MPTPVATARQCLTDDAARALNDAVSVAKRRSHSQTTSLHAVSALLSLPLSTLRDACSRATRPTTGYPPARFQLRALELCVGVALDRLPSGKSMEDDDPPISNSLMAAIKRSQANQRRNPESFHAQQMMTAPMVVKVELKHYVLSILDDPIVSRVFGDAGYRSCDVKLAILHPPVSAGLRFSRSLRCPPPIFMIDTESNGENGLGWRGFGYPFIEDVDSNFRRLGEVLVRKSGRNPLLIGACANDDLDSFTACLERRKLGILPGEINGLDVVSIAEFIVEYVGGSDGCEEKMRMKLKELEAAVESNVGSGVLVSVGDMKVLISESVSAAAVSYLVTMMTDLLRRFSSRLWLIGAMQDDEMYKQLVAKFPTVELDWDLHLVPLTYKPLRVASGPKSSLMGSFVPFGGFFSDPSEYSFLSGTSQTTTRCQVCNEKYEQEVSTILKGGGNVSSNDQCSSSLPSLLETNLNCSKEADFRQTPNEGTTFRARILSLQKKWNETCQKLHNYLSPKSGASCSKVQSVGTGSLPIEEKKQSSSRDSSVSQSSCQNTGTSMAASSNRKSSKDIMEIARDSERMTDVLPEISKVVSTVKQLPLSFTCQKMCFKAEQVSASSVIQVTTDLGLGTLCSCPKGLHTSAVPEIECLHPNVTSVSNKLSTVGPKICEPLTKPFVHGSEPRSPLDMRDVKSLWQALTDRVSWQEEAICKISQCISHCRTSIKQCRGSNIWISLTGNDKVCRMKIAAALAEAVTGSKHGLVYINLGSHDEIKPSDSIFSRSEIKGDYLPNRGKTMADWVAGKLSSRPNSVVFLENLDKADLLIQSSLSRAIKTARFADSHGREISINNMIFILSTSSTSSKNSEDVSFANENIRFPEETILKAKCWKLRITMGNGAAEPIQYNYKNVMITQPDLRILGKRKCDNAQSLSPGSQKSPRAFLDLNLPAEESEEELKNEKSDSETVSFSESSDAWLEQLLSDVDEMVDLRPYNFDTLADKVLLLISQSFQKELGSGIKLQIDHEAFIQILAASWLSDREEAIEDWVKSVLVKGFLNARKGNCMSSESTVQLVVCEGMLMEDESPDICLPCSIIVN